MEREPHWCYFAVSLLSAVRREHRTQRSFRWGRGNLGNLSAPSLPRRPLPTRIFTLLPVNCPYDRRPEKAGGRRSRACPLAAFLFAPHFTVYAPVSPPNSPNFRAATAPLRSCRKSGYRKRSDAPTFPRRVGEAGGGDSSTSGRAVQGSRRGPAAYRGPRTVRPES